MCVSSFASGTFMGMSQADAAGRIDLAHANAGEVRWCILKRGDLMHQADTLMYQECVRIVFHRLKNVAYTVLAQWEVDAPVFSRRI